MGEKSFEKGIESVEDTAEQRATFRVSIFGAGGSSGKQDKIAASLAECLAKDIVVYGGHKVVSGGGSGGVMGAASKGAKEEALRLGREDLLPEGIIVGKVFGEVSEDAKLTNTDSLNERLKLLIEGSDACVVLYGKTGTAHELLSAIVSSAVESLKNGKRKPVIIADQSLRHVELLSALSERDAERFPMFAENVYVVSSSDAGAEVVNRRVSEDVNFIIESHYKESIGQHLEDGDKEKLDSLSLSNFIKTASNFENGEGI
ncbi:MAG: LOG family protein [Candidatus Staskawiczbacteria bacterium]|jgi:predicted Rossmann-fold nucleotide-binding protein